MSDLVCIGSMLDKTYAHTISRLIELGHSIRHLDLATVINEGEMEFDPAGRRLVITNNGDTVRLEMGAKGYMRVFDISSGAPDEYLRMKALYRFQHLSMSLRMIDAPCLVGRSMDLSNLSKIYHSYLLSDLAREFGIKTPESLLTNNPKVASEFLAYHSYRVICKGASSYKTIARVVSKCDNIANIINCPTLLQEYIERPDVRVHSVNGMCSGEIIVSCDVDYRFSKNKHHFHSPLPDFVLSFSKQLNKRLSAPLLGVDFKLNAKSGDWYFLEANSMPAYHGYDKRDGGNISFALSEYLS